VKVEEQNVDECDFQKILTFALRIFVSTTTSRTQPSSQFIDFAKDLCEKIRAQGYWADFIDPCSGLPMLTVDCNKVYSEVDGMECLLNYKSHNAGFCKILTHPRWGSAVYVMK